MDLVFQKFLEANWQHAKELASASDMVELMPLGSAPPRVVLARFHAGCYIKTPSGIRVRKGFTVGYRFPEQYLSSSHVMPLEALQFLEPANVFHPNIRPPGICLGLALKPGTELRELLFRVYELVTYQRRSNPADPLNPEACQWVRTNWPVKPADARPLKWRAGQEEENSAHAGT